jgi:hypothetical protein
MAMRYIPDAQIAAWNAQIAAPRPGVAAAEEALTIIIEHDLAQIIADIDGSGVTLLTDRATNANGAIIARSETDVQFSNDPWYWEGLTYRPREAS